MKRGPISEHIFFAGSYLFLPRRDNVDDHVGDDGNSNGNTGDHNNSKNIYDYDNDDDNRNHNINMTTSMVDMITTTQTLP